MLNIQIDEIKENGLLLEGEVSPDAFPLLVEITDEGTASFPQAVHYRFNVSRLVDMIEVSGFIDAVVELSCGRCLDSYQMPFSSNFFLAYTQQLPVCTDDEDEDEETELSAEEMGLTLLEGDEISLAEPLQEQLLMALPIQPLCQNDCNGLCPVCGCNLNKINCGCEEPSFDTRFASLKEFKVKKNN